MTIRNQSAPPLSPHRQRKHDAMQQRILEQARRLMREQGVAALSMQELARRLDLRAPSLYHYFAGKTEIYDALFRLGFTLFGEHMQAFTAGARTWQEYVRLSFEGYFTFAQQHPELYQLCFERPVPGFEPSEASLQLSLEQLHQAYRRAEQWLPTLDSGLPPQQLTDLLIAMMHGLTALHLANQPGLPLGQGRFGSLIPAVMDLLENAWSRP